MTRAIIVSALALAFVASSAMGQPSGDPAAPCPVHGTSLDFFAWMDLNKDRKVTREEWTYRGGSADRFIAADINKDGAFGPYERDVMYWSLSDQVDAAIDTDKDGRNSTQEKMAFMCATMNGRGPEIGRSPAPPAPQPSAQQTAISPQVTGRWIGGIDYSRNGEFTNEFSLELKAEGGKLTGSMMNMAPIYGKVGYPVQPLKDGLISGANISFLVNFGREDQYLTGDVNGEALILARQRSDGVWLPPLILKRFSP